MKKLLTLLFILFLSQICYGFTNYFNYRTINKGKDFSFPLFSNSANRYSAGKINQFLQIGELEVLKGFESDNIFETISIDDGRIYGGKVHIDYEIYDNSQRVLSLKLNQSSCGATCTYWVSYYNFNSGNGDLVRIGDLFTKRGYEKFFAFAAKRRIARHKREIQKLESSEREGFEGIIGSYEADDLTDFYIENNSLFLDGENSFLKNQKFSGIETVSKFKHSEFKSYLNNYGKTLFSLNKNSIKIYRSKMLPQVFEGKIGNSKVLLVLNTGYKNEIRAEYVYIKYGKGIYLVGEIKGNKISLTEKLPEPRETGFVDYIDNGYVEAEFDGKNIVGMWTNRTRSKFYDLRLKRK